MAIRHKREPFYLPGSFLVRKALTYNGEKFAIGEVFPYEELGVTERKMRDMYVAGYLMKEGAVEDKKYREAVKNQQTVERKLSRAERKKLARAERNKEKDTDEEE